MRMLLAVSGVAVAVALGLAGSGLAAKGGNTVGASGVDFTPKKLSISKGEKVVWKNGSGSHTVTFKSGFDEPLDSSNRKVTRSFKKAGTFNYVCTFHVDSGMKGKIVVR